MEVTAAEWGRVLGLYATEFIPADHTHEYGELLPFVLRLRREFGLDP